MKVSFVRILVGLIFVSIYLLLYFVRGVEILKESVEIITFSMYEFNGHKKKWFHIIT